MGLEEVRKEILSKSRKDAEGIIKAAEAEAKNIVNSAKEQIDEYRKSVSAEIKKDAEGRERIEAASANAAARHILLEKKKDVIDKAFEEAKRRIVKQAKSKNYAEKLLKKVAEEIDIAAVYCSKEFAKEIKGYNVKESDIKGIIGENADGTVRVDLTFDSMVNDIKSRLLHDVAQVLFKKN